MLFDGGPLAPAVAASMAIPGLVKPVVIDGRVLIDGGVVDPLPYRPLIGKAAIVIACDVTGGPVAEMRGPPKPYQALLGSGQILQTIITREMLRTDRPDILLRPAVDRFRALDFFHVVQILNVAESLKDEIKRELEAQMEARA